MDTQKLAKLAVPVVVLLVAFLSYSSQYLFYYIEPDSLTFKQSIIFNSMILCIWVSYARACMVDPGQVPLDWKHDKAEDTKPTPPAEKGVTRQRYCRKCEAVKPPRSHHCRVCKRCIPKMDHHCPWTVNCVSHFNFPHFMRFLLYAVASMCLLEYFLYLRVSMIWDNRNMPSYLGPSAWQIAHLLILMIVNTLTIFLVSITFFRSVYGLGANVTTIESWEIERHEQLLRRSRAIGGYLDGPDGVRVKITRQEFPYDIGIWNNICQGMGTANPLAWFWPLSTTTGTTGLDFETNGFEDPGTSWPPPDPDRMPRVKRTPAQGDPFVHGQDNLSSNEEIDAFKRRQQRDFEQRSEFYGMQRRRPFHERFESEDSTPDNHYENDEESYSGEESWQDSDGNRLKDYGVDEDVEFYDEDIPLSQLLARRKLGHQKEI